MSAHQAPRHPRTRKSHVPVASLVIALGLTASLGLARTVWGGPPADAEAPAESAEEPGSEDPTDPANTDLLSADPTAEPAMVEDPVASPDDPALLDPAAADSPALLDEGGASVPAASSLRAKMETSMAELGELAVEARNDEDLVRATCVLDKQDRAQDVMSLGTSELLIIRDPGTSEQARDFALEKLDAASLRMDGLVDEAKACSGRQGPEDEIDVTRREADEPSTIAQVVNPSGGLGNSPVPPPLDGGWPPDASPFE